MPGSFVLFPAHATQSGPTTHLHCTPPSMDGHDDAPTFIGRTKINKKSRNPKPARWQIDDHFSVLPRKKPDLPKFSPLPPFLLPIPEAPKSQTLLRSEVGESRWGVAMHLYNAWLPPPVAEQTAKEKESFALLVRSVQESWRPDDPESVSDTLKWIPVIELLRALVSLLLFSLLLALVLCVFCCFFFVTAVLLPL